MLTKQINPYLLKTKMSSTNESGYKRRDEFKLRFFVLKVQDTDYI